MLNELSYSMNAYLASNKKTKIKTKNKNLSLTPEGVFLLFR